ncbi:MAG TPA: MogA/MoaB family molybdenum cofactor biosynthesis protein [Phycisphaerae bacterium]|nr:MogA/MoaB family molybdenum cofactor biosynthesis protein [Phycisphaerae bacterium]
MPDAAILTISDSRSEGLARDQSGPAIETALASMGITIVEKKIVPDDCDTIRNIVQTLLGRVSLIVTTGGTGVSDRDVTSEAIEPLFEKTLPGFGEIMRTGSFEKTPLSIISRGGAGIAKRTLILMLPGSPKGVVDCLDLITPAIKHVLKILDQQKVDCQAESHR